MDTEGDKETEEEGGGERGWERRCERGGVRRRREKEECIG